VSFGSLDTPRVTADDPRMPHPAWITALFVTLDFGLRIWLTVRIIMRRLPVGVTLAWLLVILVFPFVGSAAYLVLGEYHLGRRRMTRIIEVQREWREIAGKISPAADHAPPPCVLTDPHLSRLVETSFGAPLLAGNRLELLGNAGATFPALVRAIDDARESCDLQFYIWSPGGRVDDVAAALKRAAGRGVRCRVLVDALGSAEFLRRGAADDLRRSGVAVQAALSSGLLSLLFVRPDLRLHRKIVVIDHQVGFTGSLNMADPLTFKKDAGVGEWVDAMVRVEGPAVLAMAASFLSFWSVESGQEASRAEWLEDARTAQSRGESCVQVLSSGPALQVEAIEQVVLTALYSARKEVVLTTPYFIPSESLLTALLSVAGSGIRVTLIVPARVDSMLVHYASQAYQGDLLQAGVDVRLYEGGLLHTKSITVDDELTLFGSLNLDPRSLRLNFEITLSVYDREFNARVRELQHTYLAQSRQLDLESCLARSQAMQFFQNTVRLVGPVL